MEYAKINSLTLIWILVHPITEESPLFEIAKEDFKNTDGEIIVFIKTFYDMFITTVATRSSYTFEDVVYWVKFNPMFNRDEKRNLTVLNLVNLNANQMMELY